MLEEEIENIDLGISLNQLLLEGNPGLTLETVEVKKVKEEIDKLLDARFLLMIARNSRQEPIAL